MKSLLKPEVVKCATWAVLTTSLLGILIVVGSRNLAHFDAALVAYTFASLFAMFGVTYRYAMWLQRPPLPFTGSAAGRRFSDAARWPATPDASRCG